MALDFTALQTELFARGFTYLNDSGPQLVRAKRFVNDAMHDIDDMYEWPYLQASTSGVPPITISDLKSIESVLDPTNDQALQRWDRKKLLDNVGDLTTAGTAAVYYVTAGTTVSAYPVPSLSLSVTYYKLSVDLVNPGDTPLMPDRYRPAIVELATAKAYRDKSNEQMAQACQAEASRIIDRMRTMYDMQPGDLDHQLITFASEDW